MNHFNKAGLFAGFVVVVELMWIFIDSEKLNIFLLPIGLILLYFTITNLALSDWKDGYEWPK